MYVPHPFDRMHAIPSPATLLRHLPDIDVLEVYNARLMFDAYNAEALRFQRKYGLLAGAGSDAHVLQGVGTGAVRMRRFDGPEEFLLSLRTRGSSAPAEIARLPAVPEVGRAGQGEGPLEQKLGSPRDCCRAHRRDLRTLPSEGDWRDQRAPGGAPRPRRRDVRSRPRLGPPARRHLPAQARSAAGRDHGRRGVLRPRRQRPAQVVAAARSRSARDLRDESPKFGTEEEEQAMPWLDARAPDRAAEAPRRDGHRRRRVPRRTRVPARRSSGRQRTGDSPCGSRPRSRRS